MASRVAKEDSSLLEGDAGDDLLTLTDTGPPKSLCTRVRTNNCLICRFHESFGLLEALGFLITVQRIPEPLPPVAPPSFPLFIHI
jgi:hypothetical protein